MIIRYLPILRIPKITPRSTNKNIWARERASVRPLVFHLGFARKFYVEISVGVWYTEYYQEPMGTFREMISWLNSMKT
jgi:hypothetical protein